MEAQIDAVKILKGAYYDNGKITNWGRALNNDGWRLEASVPVPIMCALVARYGTEVLFEEKKGGRTMFEEWLDSQPWKIS